MALEQHKSGMTVLLWVAYCISREIIL